ncbi:MAG: hypothetical protein DMD62_02080 [Gemmatimonadetes bacterium]|nr:MAG: hypothetical protein DMD62_02080 [Gemmatimonadota bacterium]
MTLGRLVIASIVVAAWFEIATFATHYLFYRLALPDDAEFLVGVSSRLLVERLVEALLLTLIASLWFDSLGSGGWWLLFLLVGALATVPKWFAIGQNPAPKRALVAAACAHLARYVIAGALLAWRLS